MIGHEVLARLSRQQRRHLLDAERRARLSGDWGPWELLPIALARRGWLGQVTQASRNRVFCVLRRPVESAAGAVTHLAITSLSTERPTWWEAQRIKNELAGEAATAVEVYPPQGEVVDGADMYHLWVLPGPLPFSLADGLPGGLT